MDIPLFELPDPAPPRRAKTLREKDREARPTWSRYNPRTRVACDECITLLHESRGQGYAAQSARWRLRQGALDLVLCHAHAQARRIEQGKDEQ